MKFNYTFGKYLNKRIMHDINLASEILYNKLRLFDLDTIDIGSDIRKYFSNKKEHLRTNLVKYSYQLSYVLSNLNYTKEDITIIDHGGGTGMFGLLCKQYGIGTVIYNDINEKWTLDAKAIGLKLGLQSEHYIAGDIDALTVYLNDNLIHCHALVSYNTIEHVYDMKKLIFRLSEFSDRGFLILMSTGANQYNPFTRRTIIPLQIIAEYGDPNTKLFGDGKPYFELRKEIISSYNNNLSSIEIEQLSKVTRGLIDIEIKKTVDLYLKQKILPPVIKHKTNTCDPYSGYWVENFMNPFEIKDLMMKLNFQVEVLPGFYGKPQNIIKNFISSILNLIIRIFKTKSLIIAPYWTLSAKKI
ncbi:MAG: hypothetical protein KF816_09990 [Melioribacteraceae bacterium]|nr:hypothetical protein [Melioribacteraceae bacterium]